MATHPKRAVGHNYRQLKLQITHETGGRLSFRLYAKGLNDTWAERHLISMGSHECDWPIVSTEDAIACCMDLLRAQMLPGTG